VTSNDSLVSAPPSSIGTRPLLVQNMAATATPSPKTRKQPCCRTCGLPMRGHPKNGCPSPQSSPTPARSKIEDLEVTLQHLQLDTSEETPTKQHRRSSMRMIKQQPSLESLTSSAVGTLELVLASQKQESGASALRSNTNTPRPSQAHVGGLQSTGNGAPSLARPPMVEEKTVNRPRRSIMPGTLKLESETSLEEFDNEAEKKEAKEIKTAEPESQPSPAGDSDKENSPRPPSVLKSNPNTPSPNPTSKKRKSVRVSLPGYTRSSLRLQQAQPLDVTEADGMLRATFFKTTVQQATLFKFTSQDAASLEEAASKLGLQSHYYSRSPSNASPDEDVNWLIIGKNPKAIEDMLQTMENEAAEASPSGDTKVTQKQVTSHFLAGLTAAGVVGAAAMWAGLAFA
jgi:hypothetical protein